jgi:type VII secretion-associated serine protease mycosin
VPVTATSPSAQSCQSGLSDSPDIASVNTVPWAQNALDFSSVWPLTRGGGVTVAVIDSGVDYTPQLAGRLTAIDVTGSGNPDCVGHGTAVAGIIAASDEQEQGNGFAGVAPDASILSVKVADAESTDLANPQLTGDAATLSTGIRDAVERGAQVLSISITSTNSPGLASAVAFAESQNVVVVAAGGNDETGGPKGPFFPASYPGVISVGALNPDGSLASFADPNTQEEVTAPGVNITSTVPGGYNNQLQGTSFATPFVSGVAALVRARFPTMTAAQVVARIEATADGPTGTVTGNGMVNPLQAVQAVLPFSADLNQAPAKPQPVSVSRPVPPDQDTIDTAMLTTVGSVGAAALVAAAAVVIGVGRRRRRAGAAQAPSVKSEADGGLTGGPYGDEGFLTG